MTLSNASYTLKDYKELIERLITEDKDHITREEHNELVLKRQYGTEEENLKNWLKSQEYRHNKFIYFELANYASRIKYDKLAASLNLKNSQLSCKITEGFDLNNLNQLDDIKKNIIKL